MATFTVAFYEIDRAYGGPEEGGWWYNTGDLVRIFRTFKCEAAAYRCAARANDILSIVQKGRRSVGSMAYCGGRYAAEVYDVPTPVHFPVETPYYC